MKKITISAPGKLMLLGEHAVVYNRPCLVTAVDQRMKATVEVTDDSIFSLEAPDVNVTGYSKPMKELGKGEMPKGAQFVENAVRNFSEKYHLTGGLKVTTHSEFSSQFGFGSSSASTVCVVKALREMYSSNEVRSNIKVDSRLRGNDEKKELFDIAYKTVLDVQGKGSGFDVAAGIYGGCLYFVTGGKVIEPISVDSLPLIVGYTGIKADTITLVNQISVKKKQYPEKMEKLFNAIVQLVEQAKVALQTNDYERLGKLMDFNQEYLRDLGVSSERLENLIDASKKSGAYGAKLSGAGVGDCMIALAPPDKTQAVKQAISEAGGQVIEIETNVEGVRVED